MKAVFSSAYFPPVDYFRNLILYDEILLEQHEHYPKQTWRNRCNIYSPNGLQVLSVPVDKEGQLKVKFRDLKISFAESWQKQHIRSLETAYNTSPYFLYYRDEIIPLLEKPSVWLIELNLRILETLLKLMKVGIQVRLTEEYLNDYGEVADFRYTISPKLPARGEFPIYQQVFMEKHGFLPNLSILDVLFNLGPEAAGYLKRPDIIER